MIAATLASACRLLSGATAEWRCDPSADVQRIYFANHSSHLDFVVIWSMLPPGSRRSTRPVAGRDYWAQSALRRYLAAHVFRAVLVDRQPAGSTHAEPAARATIECMAREMGQRDSLIVFPEGTRSKNGEIGPFRSGLYHLSQARPDVELVPVHLENLNRILPKGEALPVPMLSRVTFGPALSVTTGEPKDRFLDRAREALYGLQEGAAFSRVAARRLQ
jgi:1-acyl-sn-glycerol-3-phosphate acyltransferase